MDALVKKRSRRDAEAAQSGISHYEVRLVEDFESARVHELPVWHVDGRQMSHDVSAAEVLKPSTFAASARTPKSTTKTDLISASDMKKSGRKKEDYEDGGFEEEEGGGEGGDDDDEISVRCPGQEDPPNPPTIFDAIIFTIGLFHAFVTVGVVLSWIFGAGDENASQRKGAVVTDAFQCSSVGRDVLRGGGSAVDAAVAAAFCMCVQYPHVASLGGGGFLLVHRHRLTGATSRVLDFRESAPARLTPALLAEGKIRSSTGSAFHGGVYVGVPGLPAGLHAAHKKYGRLKWRELVEPSVAMARKGALPLHDHVVAACASRVRDSTWTHAAKGADSSLMKRLMDATTKTVGFKNPALADTLDLMAKDGVDAFYKGRIADRMVSAVQRAEGVLSKYDLQGYSVRWQRPLNVSLPNNYTLLTAGPPSAGAAVAASLAYIMLNPVTRTKGDNNINRVSPTLTKPEAEHLLMEANKKAQADFLLSGALGDPNFGSGDQVNKRVRKLLSPSVLGQQAAHVRKSHTLQPVDATSGGRYVMPEAAGTEIQVMDDDELYVSLVFGLNSYFGARVEAEGFFLNNAMANFFPAGSDTGSDSDAVKNANVMEPNKRPLSLGAPVVVVSSSHMCKTRLVAGSPKFDILAQVIARYLALGSPLADSIHAPRLHLGAEFGTRDYLMEALDGTNQAGQLPSTTVDALEAKGISFSVLRGPYVSCDALVKYQDSVDGQADPRTNALVTFY